MSTRRHRNHSDSKLKRYARYRVRCRFCWARRTLSKLPEFYVLARRCTCVGARKARKEGRSEWWVDWHRTAKFEAKATTCYCLGNPHPHRRGSYYPSLGAQCDHIKQT